MYHYIYNLIKLIKTHVFHRPKNDKIRFYFYAINFNDPCQRQVFTDNSCQLWSCKFVTPIKITDYRLRITKHNLSEILSGSLFARCTHPCQNQVGNADWTVECGHWTDDTRLYRWHIAPVKFVTFDPFLLVGVWCQWLVSVEWVLFPNKCNSRYYSLRQGCNLDMFHTL